MALAEIIIATTLSLLGLVIFVSANKLYDCLEENHEIQIDKLRLPKRLGYFFWFAGPISSIKWAWFIFSSNHFGNEQIRKYKGIQKVSWIALVLLVVLGPILKRLSLLT